MTPEHNMPDETGHEDLRPVEPDTPTPETPPYARGRAIQRREGQEDKEIMVQDYSDIREGRHYLEIEAEEGEEAEVPLDEVVWPVDEIVNETLAQQFPDFDSAFEDTDEGRLEKEGVIDALKKLTNPASNADAIIAAANYLADKDFNISGEEVIRLLTARGKDQTTIDALMRDIDRLPKAKEDESQEHVSEVEQHIKTTGEDAVSEAKAALESKDPTKIEQARSKLQEWLDENPGFWHKANRLAIRPGISLLFILGVLYLLALNSFTKGTARK